MNVRIEGTVFDVNRQAWTASDTLLLHPSSRYVGLRTAKSFVERGETVEVELAVVDLDGKPVQGEVEVRFARMEWDWDDVRGSREVPTDPKTCDVTAGADGLARCAFPTVTGGSYQVLASTRDEEGRRSESELRVWVAGGEVAPARDVALEELTLVPELKEVSAGQTAKILVQAPFYPAEGVLTLRRDGLLSTERFTMDGPTTTLSVPILDAHVPELTVWGSGS
jgi:uncharacterized protein YfaS (alpha-2-macroglobulin family)